VVIPVYNGERFVASALASVRGQTHLPAQVIVVDDGSTDRTAAIVQRLADGWPELQLVSQPNRGPSVARNVGIARADGELLTFLDADDEMLPERIAIQARYLAEHPEMDVVMGRERVSLEEGVAPPEWLKVRIPKVADFYMMSMMIRRPAFDRVGPFDPDRRLGEDVDWLFRARGAGLGIATITDEVVHRRLHGTNLTIDLTLEEQRRILLDITRSRVAARRIREEERRILLDFTRSRIAARRDPGEERDG
jgi:glycosyltransferase involved in cell wall biosynthesis